MLCLNNITKVANKNNRVWTWYVQTEINEKKIPKLKIQQHKLEIEIRAEHKLQIFMNTI